MRKQIQEARDAVGSVDVPDIVLETAARLGLSLGTDGLRGELTIMRAARAAASLNGKSAASLDELKQVAPLALRHRLRRNPLDDSGSSARIERALSEVFAA